MSWSSGQLLAVDIKNPNDLDILYWNEANSAWQNIAPSGLGLITEVFTNDTLTGDGLPSDVLSLAVQSGLTPGPYTLADLTVNEYGVISAIGNGTIPPGTVHTDGTSIIGDGSSGNVIRQGTAPTKALADWMVTSVTVSGGSTTASIPNSSLDTNYTNNTGSNLSSGGVFTVPAATINQPIQVDVSLNDISSGVGNYITDLQIQFSNGVVTNKSVAWTKNPGTLPTNMSCSAYFSGLPAANTIRVIVITNSTASGVTYNAHVSIYQVPFYMAP